MMKTNREKFLALVTAMDTQTEIENDWEIANRFWLRASQRIALDILKQLTRLGWTQKDLADKMGVSPQHIHKIVKGGENLTLETQVKLQEILDIPILASYFKAKMLRQQPKLVALEMMSKPFDFLTLSEGTQYPKKAVEIKTKKFLLRSIEMNLLTDYQAMAS